MILSKSKNKRNEQIREIIRKYKANQVDPVVPDYAKKAVWYGKCAGYKLIFVEPYIFLKERLTGVKFEYPLNDIAVCENTSEIFRRFDCRMPINNITCKYGNEKTQFSRAIHYFLRKGYYLSSLKRPWYFISIDDEMVFNTQRDVINEYRKQHKRPKGVCIDCGKTFTEQKSTMGAKRCRCPECFQKYYRNYNEDTASIVVRKKEAEQLAKLKKQWKMKNIADVIVKLLEYKEI